MINEIIQGDCLTALKQLPDQSVHCCITSPPYWGLRDYGVDRQIGLEETLDEYVKRMVEVFHEVRRVLRDDGTLWLNLGDTYCSTAPGTMGDELSRDRIFYGVKDNTAMARRKYRPMTPQGLKPKDLVGIPWRVAFALQQPYTVPMLVKRDIDQAWLAALFDGEGCIGIRRFDSYRKEKQQVYQDGFVVYTVVTNNDVELLEKCIEITGLGKALLKQAAENIDRRGIKSKRDSYGWRLDGNGAVEVIRSIYPYLVAKRKQACIAYTLDILNKRGHGSRSVPVEIQEKKRYLWELIKKCNQREAVDLPNWIEEPMPKIEPGWYLRSDIIWQKPSCMPESVRDRPTRCHEYIFLLSKKPKYYYDKEAIMEPAVGFNNEPVAGSKGAFGPEQNRRRKGNSKAFRGDGTYTKGRSFDNHLTIKRESHGNVPNESGLRNKRSVWTVATQPFSEAHFATFPEKLIEPCILAGCPEDGIVLDPFFGSGTTGVVSIRYGRKFVGIELNPNYIEIANRRLSNVQAKLNLV